MEGDDQQDPVVDAVRSFLDGHIVLSREMAGAGHYPPVDVLDSLSRLMPAVTTREHRARAALARGLMSAYAKNEDLLKVGAYKAGMDAELDRAVAARGALLRFCAQASDERAGFAESVAALEQMVL
jgi:flagellum-specific ATP synthase